MIPILASSYPFIGNGLGGLSDALECIVEHEVNGIYELRMRYPITGLHYDELANGCIIMAKPDVLTQTQPFRIYRITKPLNGVVTVYAQHISYDMAGIIVAPFSSASLTSALIDLPNYCTPSSPFNITSTKTVATAFNLHEPKQLWRVLGGSQGSFLDLYGGEWDFDRLDATLKTRLGADRGVQIRYAKNLTQLEQDATLESTYSGVYPYWYDEDTNTLVKLPEDFVTVTGAVVSDRLLLLDCSGDFENQPSAQDLRDRANNYIAANSVGAAKVSWKVNFVQLAQSKEFADQAVLEQVMLGDTVGVFYEALGVNASARIVKTEYDALKEAYQSVTVGRVKQNLASIIVGQNEVMDDKIDAAKSSLERAVDRATDFITNGAGYMRLIYNSTDELVEIVSLDNPDISLAQNVWRWNNGGFGFSSTGYNGTYGLALTQAGEIVADYITAGTLNASVIRAGILTDALGHNSWNLDTGAFTITDGSINIETSSASYDQIVLKHNQNASYDYETSLKAGGFLSRNKAVTYGQAGREISIGPLSVMGSSIQNPNGVGYGQGFILSDGALSLYGHAGTDATKTTIMLLSVASSAYDEGLTISRGGGKSWLTYDSLTLYNSSAKARTQIQNGTIYLNDTSGSPKLTLQYGLVDVGGSGTSGVINVRDTGGTKYLSMDGTQLVFRNGANYVALLYPNGTQGQLGLGDGTSTIWRTVLNNSGLQFNNASGTQTAKYGNAILKSTYTQITVGTSWTRSKAITIPEEGLYAITGTLEYNNSAPRGIALVTRNDSNATLYHNIAVNEYYQSITGNTVSVMRVGTVAYLLQGNEVWLYTKSASSASNNCGMWAHRIA